jgi:hypothetical protein
MRKEVGPRCSFNAWTVSRMSVLTIESLKLCW